MRTIKLLFFFLTITFFTIGAKAQKINVRIYADQSIKEITFVPSFGKYSIEVDKTRIELNKTSKAKLKAEGDKIKLLLNDSLIGNYKKVKFNSEGLMSFFLVTPNNGKVPERRYDDNLIITNDTKESLRLINNIEIESYIAGVVQAETWGATTNVEFFKLQAICVRNYLMMNISKHEKDGYQMCDGVHCQAYKGRANQPEVVQGAYNSKGEVIVDKDGNMIETLFHANSGGETVNSEDVWGKPFSHLISVKDTFSIGTKAYSWDKFIKIKDWQRYFKDKGVNIKDDSIKHELLNFSQKDGRKKEMLGVSLVQIRKDFGLRSTFFDCQEWGSEVKLTGRGYGHGVGLSQEGAIKMCEEGYEYWQVIEHYYSGAKVKRIEENIIINNEEEKTSL